MTGGVAIVAALLWAQGALAQQAAPFTQPLPIRNIEPAPVYYSSVAAGDWSMQCESLQSDQLGDCIIRRVLTSPDGQMLHATLTARGPVVDSVWQFDGRIEITLPHAIRVDHTVTLDFAGTSLRGRIGTCGPDACTADMNASSEQLTAMVAAGRATLRWYDADAHPVEASFATRGLATVLRQ